MNGRKIASVAIVCFLLFTIIGVSFVCIQSYNEERYPAELHTSIVGYDSYDNRVIGIDTETLYSSGYRNGDYITLSSHDFSTRAIVVPTYDGLFLFEYFIHTSDSGEVCIGRQCAGVTLVIGDNIDIKFSQKSNRDNLMPKFTSGKCSYSEGMTDEEFVNFRCVETTGMKSSMIYRSYNAFAPTTDEHAVIMDTMFDRYTIGQIIDMKTSLEDVKNDLGSGKVIAENAQWYVDNEQIFAKEMSVDIFNDPQCKELFEYIADNDGPYLIHCSLGRDRTGFIAVVLESLMGATYEEMCDDYCLSYACLYDMDTDSQEYEMVKIMFNPMMIAFHDPDILYTNVDLYSLDVDVTKFDFKADAERYLKDDLGMSSDDIEKIRQKLTKD